MTVAKRDIGDSHDCHGRAPFWWQLATYRTKILAAGCCFAANLLLVSAKLGFGVGWQLLGIALSDLGGGLGEASLLAISQAYAEPQTCLSGFSSGTGAAGVLGYLLSMFVLPKLHTHARLLLAAAVIAGYWLAFFCLRPRPPPFAHGDCRPHGTKGEPTGGERRAGADVVHDSVIGGGEASTALLASEAGVAPCCAPEVHVQTSANDLRAVGAVAPPTGHASYGDLPSFRPSTPPLPAPGLATPMTTSEKLRLLARLCRVYVLPLVVVYWAEYAMQAGAWTVFALPAGALDSPTARSRAYQALNLAYQIGVFISRSAGKLCSLSTLALWGAALAQVGLLALFVAIGATQAWVGPSLLAPALVVGLLGGTLYVQTCLAIDRTLPARERELALATVSVGTPIGILAADATGLLLQWCLFRVRHLPIAHGGGWCPF